MTARVSEFYPRAKAAIGRGPRVPEKIVERCCDQLYASAGCEVVRFSQARATQQTPGIPDRKVYHRPSGCTFWFEVKAQGGQQSKHQRAFQAMAEACGETYVLGGLEAAEAQLIAMGLARRDGRTFTLTPGGWRERAVAS